MSFASLALHNFRSYSRYAINLSANVNIVVGPNGSGKTNLLEALYVLSTGSTFRGSELDLVAHGSDWFRLEGVWEDQKRILTYRLRPGLSPEKQFNIDGSKKVRLNHGHRVPLVLFEPNHLRLLTDSPSVRRHFMDGLLVNLLTEYSWLKHQFERVLLQRNNLLKKHLPLNILDDSLFIWDIKFSELAKQIIEHRQKLIAQFNERISSVYSDLALKSSVVKIEYISNLKGTDYQAETLKQLQLRREQDRARGFTTFGPQRDDFKISLNGSLAETSASRGEMRSLLLALKLIELEFIMQSDDRKPILLLDDVFSELDTTRQSALAQVASKHQTIITTTEVNHVNDYFKGCNLISTVSP